MRRREVTQEQLERSNTGAAFYGWEVTQTLQKGCKPPIFTCGHSALSAVRVWLAQEHWDQGADTNRAGLMSSSEIKTGKPVLKPGCTYFSNHLGDLTANPILPLVFFWLGLLLVDWCQNRIKRLREHKGPKQPLPSMSLCITPSWNSIFKPDVSWIDTLHCYQWSFPSEELQLTVWAKKVHWREREKNPPLCCSFPFSIQDRIKSTARNGLPQDGQTGCVTSCTTSCWWPGA